MELRGKTALVTGASSGIGDAFARQLAAMGADLVIVARRKDRLDALGRELTAKHGVQVTPLGLDLSDAGSPAELYRLTEGSGRTVDVVINNAGFGAQDHFLDIPWERTAEQLRLNVVGLTEIMHRFLGPMRERGRGWMLNVSSIGAYAPSPDYATYSAGKAYVRDVTEAVSFELRKSGVRLCCLCPGLTVTEFHQVAGHQLPGFMRSSAMSAERCAAIGLRAVFGWRSNVVAGFMNKAAMFMLRFMPRAWLPWGGALMVGKADAERPKRLKA